MENILAVSKKLDVYFQYKTEIDFQSVAKILNELLGADIIIADYKGKIVGSFPEMLSETLPEEYLPLISKNTLANIMVDDECCAAVPVLCCNNTFMIMAVGKNGGDGFDDDQIMLLENAASVIGLKINHKDEEVARNKSFHAAKIQLALDVLSYSEMQSAIHILDALGGNTEGILVASKIADSVGITRSVIVNALRKLESATLIEAKSLGMKGTFIRVINPLLFDELAKRKTM